MSAQALRPGAVAAALLVACALLAGCESTQDRSARLAKKGSAAFRERGLRVTRTSSSVKVVSTAVLTDQNGTAVVVALRNTSSRTLTGVPVAIDVQDAHGKSVFKNDAAGIQPSLTSVSVMRPREEFLWVNDQVQPTGTPKSVKVKVGVEKGSAAASIPALALATPTLQNDPTSGINALDFLANQSKIDQLKVTVFCVAQKGGKVVAAGRAGIQRLRAGKQGRFHVYFIGDPRGAKLTLAAPPTVLG